MTEQVPTEDSSIDGAASALSAGLERCPHCGSNDLWGPNFTEYIGDNRSPRWWVECRECPAGMEVKGETPKALIEAWNKRSNVELTGVPPTDATKER